MFPLYWKIIQITFIIESFYQLPITLHNLLLAIKCTSTHTHICLLIDLEIVYWIVDKETNWWKITIHHYITNYNLTLNKISFNHFGIHNSWTSEK